jgi:hypothetical protein
MSIASTYLIYTTSNFFTCFSFTAQVSTPYRDVAIVLSGTCVFRLIGIRLSNIIPTKLFTEAVMFPHAWNMVFQESCMSGQVFKNLKSINKKLFLLL